MDPSTSGTSNALVRKRTDTDLMPPPPPAKKIKRPKQVLDEDTYTETLSQIIARDFFPGLLETETQQEYLDALDSKDAAWISSAGRRLQHVMTPGRRNTPLPSQSRSTLPGDRTPSTYGGDTPASVASTAMGPRPRLNTNMSLSKFQETYTSEDNESFYKLVDKQNQKRAEKYAWLWRGNKLPSKQMIKQKEVEDRLSQTRSLTDDGFKRDRLAIKDRDDRPARPDTWDAKPKNNLMFGPEGVEDGVVTVSQKAEEASRMAPKSISYENTRMPQPRTPQRPPSPTMSSIRDAIAGKPRVGDQDSSAMGGGETPRVNGYAFVDDEDDEPEPAPVPIINLGPGDASPNPFRLQEQRKRESLHERMVDRISQSKKESSRNGLTGKVDKTPVPKFPSSPRVTGGLTPAAQRLWSKIGTPGRGSSGSSFGQSKPMTPRGSLLRSVPGEVSDEISDYDDDYEDPENEDNVLKALCKVQTSAPFASIFKFEPVYHAGLRVYDVGLIKAPLQESQARQLIAKARRERLHSNGHDIKAGASGGKTWELEPKHFSFTDSRWGVFKDYLCNKIRLQLGTDRPIQANLTKMVIYEEGAMYEAQSDTEGMSNAFATLVLCLPSKHRGGEMVFEHGGQTPKVYNSCSMSQSFAFWFPGVSHKLLPVTSGYRWALIFKLVIGPGSLPLSTCLLIPTEIQALKDSLRRWLSTGKESREHEYLYYVLNSSYHLGSSQRSLKGRDLGHALALKAASNELPFEVFLGSLDKHARRINTLVDFEGHMVAQDHLKFDDDNVLNLDRFSDLDEEVDVWKTREDKRITVVAIVPHDSLVSFLKYDAKMSPDALRPVTEFLARSSSRPGSSMFCLETFMKLYYRPKPRKILQGNTLQLVLQAAVQQRQFELFREAAVRHHGTLSVEFFSCLRDWLVTDPDPDNVLKKFEDIQEGASLAISLYGRPSEKLKAISLLAPHPTTLLAGDVKTPKRMLDWARPMIRSCLDSLGSASLGWEEGSLIVDLTLYFKDPAAFLEQTVIPRTKRIAHPVPFHLAFLAQLQKHSTKSTLPVEDFTRIYRETARWLIETSNFSKLTSGEEARSLAFRKAREAGEPLESVDPSELRFTILPRTLINFFGSLVKESTESDDLASLFISKLAIGAPRFPADQVPTFWMPFLNSVPQTLNSSKIPLDTPCYQQLFSAMFRSCLENFVGSEPVDTQPPLRSSISCDCADCLWANEFLADPSRRTGSLPSGHLPRLDGLRRTHLERGLYSSGVNCTCETMVVDARSCALTLMVTKTPSPEHVQSHEAWVRRRGQTLSMFMKFEDHLRLLLGLYYPLFLDLKMTTAPAPMSHGPVRGPKTQGGVKRKLQDTDIIDLTGTTKAALHRASNYKRW